MKHIKQATKAYTIHTQIEPNLFQKIEKLQQVKSSSPASKQTKITSKSKVTKPNALQHQCKPTNYQHPQSVNYSCLNILVPHLIGKSTPSTQIEGAIL
jgi:hypothetical protein